MTPIEQAALPCPDQPADAIAAQDADAELTLDYLFGKRDAMDADDMEC